MKSLFILACILSFVFLEGNNNICQLSGKLDNLTENTYLYLWDYDSHNLVDSIFVEEGVFKYLLKVDHPKQYILSNKQFRDKFRDRKIIWLEPGEIKLTGNFLFLKNLKVNGSKSQQAFENYNQIVRQNKIEINNFKDSMLFNEDLIISNLVYLSPDSLNEKERQAIIEFDLIKSNCVKKTVAHLIKNNESYVTLSVLYNESLLKFNQELNRLEIKEVYDKLPDFLKSTHHGMQVKKFIDILGVPKIGYLAPDIIQTNQNGDTVKLSDFKEKYVLIYFWASWCKPCRASNKKLKEIYKEFKPLGFEILGVSWDKKKSDWENACIHDSLPWTNISDLKSVNSDVFLEYNIRGVPSGFLIDKNRKIISKYYDTYFLRKELNRIFKNKIN